MRNPPTRLPDWLPTSLALEQAINSANAAKARLVLQNGLRAADRVMARADIRHEQRKNQS